MRLANIHRARAIVAPYIDPTPVLTARTLSEMASVPVYLKAENLQKTGSFKVRGAAVKMASLTPEERARGVVAASAGNHAQGVALAAHSAGVSCAIVMPRGASLAKVEATRSYGAAVILDGETYDDAQAHARRLAEEQGKTLVHGFDDEAIIAGQGTLGLEVLEEAPDADVVVVPVGGGGLIAGMALAIKETRPSIRVIGVQTEMGPAAAQSFHRRERVSVRPRATLADGIAVGQPGVLPFELILRYVDDMVTVTEEEIAQSMVLLLERTKLLVEGAGAVALAAILKGAVPRPSRGALAVLSGGNVDPHLLPKVLDYGLIHAGRLTVLSVLLLDRPGRLAGLLAVFAEEGVNVLDVFHRRHSARVPPGQVLVEVMLETRDAAHIGEIGRLLERHGYVRGSLLQGGGGQEPLLFMSSEAAIHEAGGGQAP
jgi:threonine dehydratase